MTSFRRWFLATLAASAVKAESVQKPGLQLPPGAAVYQAAVKTFLSRATRLTRSTPGGMMICCLFQKHTLMDGTDGAFHCRRYEYHVDYGAHAVNHTANTDFNIAHTPDTVSLFETTIRYVGGFIMLVEKAQDLADQMAFAWVGNQSIPYGYIDFTNQQPTIATSNIAEAGTLSLEWNRLSKYTGNSTYQTLAEQSVQHMIQMSTPLPGMPAQGIDPKTGNAVGGYVTWGGGSDSYFEYLIKYARLTNTDDNSYADAWLTAVDTSMKTLLRTSTVDNWLYLADYDDNKNIRHVGSHLACFYGGNWILGGKLTNNDTMVLLGLQLTDACWNTYASTADGNYTGDTATQDQLDFYYKHGFYITGADYFLRPEVLESNLYAWRATG
ncbi:glycoside hydrolase [Suillus lakei]|nr:glycoside hydrolase [Suillus lakei]